MSISGKVRESKYAGVFYPADTRLLQQQINHYLSSRHESHLCPPMTQDDFHPDEQETILSPGMGVCDFHNNVGEAVTGAIKAIIAPHAGYDYSGQVAGIAYAALQASSDIRRIAIFAPNHQTTDKGALLSSHDSWKTPLGDVTVDQDFIARHWKHLSQVSVNDEVCQAEYSIEVQLPFIQQVLPDIPIVPILLGESRPGQMLEILRPVWESGDTLIIISSDLYHYLPRAKALPSGIEIARMIEQNDYKNLTSEAACGYVALRGVMELAGEAGHYWRTLCVRHSGQNNRFNLNELVGYGAFLLMENSRSMA